MLRRLSLAVAVASAFAGTAWAANAPLSAKTDLVTVYKDAVDNNADLAAARANFEAQREAVPQARAGLLPQINGGASANDTRTKLDQPSATSSRSASSTRPASASRSSALTAGSSSRPPRPAPSRPPWSSPRPSRT